MIAFTAIHWYACVSHLPLSWLVCSYNQLTMFAQLLQLNRQFGKQLGKQMGKQLGRQPAMQIGKQLSTEKFCSGDTNFTLLVPCSP